MKQAQQIIDTTSPALDFSPCYALPFYSPNAPKSELYNMDCIAGMKEYPDKYFDLAIVDPPYGIENKISIGGGSHTKSKSKFHQRYKENGKTWDKERPNYEYWIELFRVSKNQIVFGGNYFINELPISRGWIYWHKQGEKMSSVNDELIWTSFDISIKMFSRCHGKDKGFLSDHKVFHPTTKPMALYDWIFTKYTEPNMKVIDTHLGSGSSRIAAHKNKLNFVGFEIDKDYCDASDKRFVNAISQTRIGF